MVTLPQIRKLSNMINFLSFRLFLFSKFLVLTWISSAALFFRADVPQNEIELRIHSFVHSGASLTFCTQLSSEAGSGEGTGQGGLEGFMVEVAVGVLVEQGQVPSFPRAETECLRTTEMDSL